MKWPLEATGNHRTQPQTNVEILVSLQQVDTTNSVNIKHELEIAQAL